MTKQEVTLGIIGGTGLMGKLFKKIFEKHNINVLISGRKTKLTSESLIKQSNIVIYCVPIDVTAETIANTIEFTNEDQLLMDFTSIKTPAVTEMLKSKSGVVGCHPMFGPGLETISGQTIIMCPERPNKYYNIIKKLFESEGAKIKITTPKKHDEMMSIIQGMKHFSSITMCYTLKQLGIDVKESMEYTSPIYKLEMTTMGRILNQAPELYADIEIENNENIKTISNLIKNQENLLEIIMYKDKKKFIEYFNKASDHLGSFKKQAEKESDYLIKKMVEKK